MLTGAFMHAMYSVVETFSPSCPLRCTFHLHLETMSMHACLISYNVTRQHSTFK